MLGAVDIKIFGVVGILILLLIGYFVYLLYQDLVFLKKEITEIKTVPQTQENNIWHHHEEQDEEFQALNDEEQDAELERHLASFMDQQQVVPEEPELKMEEIETKEVKKRTYKKKKNAVVEEDPDQITIEV